MYQFNSEGNLKPYAVNRDKNLKRIMMGRGIIVPADTIYQLPIMITGGARSYIKTKEVRNTTIDSTSIEEFDF